MSTNVVYAGSAESRQAGVFVCHLCQCSVQTMIVCGYIKKTTKDNYILEIINTYNEL